MRRLESRPPSLKDIKISLCRQATCPLRGKVDRPINGSLARHVRFSSLSRGVFTALFDREVPSMPFPRSTNLCCGLMLALFALAGCAAPGPIATAQSPEAYDPYEDTNRQIFAFNQSVD